VAVKDCYWQSYCLRLIREHSRLMQPSSRNSAGSHTGTLYW
jgi:hypothetical protein